MATTRVLRFSYREHSWLDDFEDADQAEAEMLHRAASEAWEELPGHEELDDLMSLDLLVERWKAAVVDEWELPAEVVDVPVGKLRALMADGGLVFESGSFAEFEGHHNDTEVTVRLRSG